MKKPLLSLIVLLSIAAALFTAGLVFVWTVPHRMVVADLIREDLPLADHGLSIKNNSVTGLAGTLVPASNVTDTEKINAFIEAIQDKVAVRLSDSEEAASGLLNGYHIYFGLWQKGRDVHVLPDGRLVFAFTTSHWRNKSRLYWLRWRIDNFGSKGTAIYYMTQPDTETIKAAKDLYEVAVMP